MADDSVSPPSDQTNIPTPVSPPDQTTSSADIGQQSQDTWPISTILANDQQATPSAEPIVSEPPKEESQPQTPPREIGQVEETKSDTTWPDSLTPSAVEGTKMANDIPTDNSNLANPSSPTSDSNRPDSTVSADSSSPSIEPTSTTSAQSPQDTADSTSSPQLGQSGQLDQLPLSPVPPSLPPDIPQVPPPETLSIIPPEPSEAAKPLEEKVDTNVQSSDNQAPQVQPDAPNQIPAVDTEKPQENLANFKPEPPESPQEAPLVNQNVTASSQKTFGDLLSSENQSPPNPSTPPIPSSPSISSEPTVSPEPEQTPSPPISFGDLIKDLKPEESVGQPPQPIPTQPPVSSTPSIPQPITYNPPPIPPLSPSSPISPPSDQLSFRRQKANQARSNRKAKHLEKIMELARNTKSISNTGVQRLLHVSQSTATNYLTELARKGLLKRQGIRGGAKYSL